MPHVSHVVITVLLSGCPVLWIGCPAPGPLKLLVVAGPPRPS
ncbi:hypothetical protein YT1_4201 [Rhodococcus ruber]|nr:hypothetical protein YT1_4201 [Rhodococcus ruber]